MVLAKRTSKNQLTLPKAVVEAVGVADYYDVATENGRIVLTPVHPGAAANVRTRLADLGITEADVADAVAWSRQE
ncbi:AbrB/MazE/SpoVT family DNA-binding domain-containing protein [Synechococcus sp. CCY 9618]|uniref:AbrB/MazE/SpoVT family DNA-binding domain-containing protein n=1 Tax=Synechococcus sp. CCY 9618 TaxID=2815602 RepID=UPI001C210989|nr:AbrB/MazE/SpoVT family DNA-binding domain-containing protein [Synechococcus sp. CCY 9618]